MDIATLRPASEPRGHGPPVSSRRLVATLLFAPIAAAGWVSVAVLGLAVRLALLRDHRSQGAISLLWGLGFALFLWAGGLGVGLGEGRAIPFALVAGAATALFVYLRGAALESSPIEQPGVFHRRLVARWLKPATGSSAPHDGETAEQRRWMIWLGTPFLVAAIFVGVTFSTGKEWWLGASVASFGVDIFVLIWLVLTTDTNGITGAAAGSPH